MEGDRNGNFGCVFTSTTGWNPIASPSQCENFGMACQADFSYPESKGLLDATSQFMQYSSSSNVEMLPKFPVGSFPGIVSSYCLPVCTQNSVQSEENPQTWEEASPNGKRKRVSDPFPPPLNPTMRDPQCEFSVVKETGEKKQKIEENEGSDQSTRDAKDVSQGGEATKGYIHVRARRGQATNSHSLAERVRREKISERMKLLQELVPGCNKITGKALMLDEIINYVQSLQQQVEFLSMKLATVNPEVNADIEQILSKDILQSRSGFHPGTCPAANLCTRGFHQPVISNAATPYHSGPPQGTWDAELQTLLHMGFDSNPTINIGPNGS